MADDFQPGVLTARQARILNELVRTAGQFDRFCVAPPLYISRRAGVPNLNLSTSSITDPLAPPVTPPTSGSGSGTTPTPDDDGWPDTYAEPDYADVQFPEPMCILGVWYTHTWRTQIVSDAGRLRLDYYDLVTRANGCCACSGSGSSACDCCEPGYEADLTAYLYGPFGTDCATATLTGTLSYTNGAWEGTLTDGTITAVAKLYCVGTRWRLDSVATLADCTLLAASVPLSENEGALLGVVGVSARTDCDPPDIEAAVHHPCPTIPAGSGSSWPSDPQPHPTCDCSVCPTGAVGLMTLRDFIGSLTISGEEIAAPRDWALVHTSGCIWQQSIFTSVGLPRHWTMTLDLSSDPGSLTIGYYDDVGTIYLLATYSIVGASSCCGGNAYDPVAGDITYIPVAPETVTLVGVGDCGPCAVEVGCCPGNPVPVTLYAHFTGSISGTSTLTWDGVQWVFQNPCAPTATGRFTCSEMSGEFALADVSVGGTSIVGASAAAVSCAPPFVWTKTGMTATGGSCAGTFDVTVNTIP